MYEGMLVSWHITHLILCKCGLNKVWDKILYLLFIALHDVKDER